MTSQYDIPWHMLKGLDPANSDTCTLKGSVTTGMEPSARDEIAVKLRSVAYCARGRVFFDVKMEQVPEALKLRSLDHIHVLVVVEPKFGFVKNKVVCLRRLRLLPRQLDWSKALSVWQRQSGFQGEPHTRRPDDQLEVIELAEPSASGDGSTATSGDRLRNMLHSLRQPVKGTCPEGTALTRQREGESVMELRQDRDGALAGRQTRPVGQIRTAATVGDQTRPAATANDQTTPVATVEDQTTPVTTIGQTTSVATAEDQTTPVTTVEGQITPVATFEGQTTPVATAEGQTTPVATSEDQTTPVATVEGQTTPIGITEGQTTPVATAEDQTIPVVTIEGQTTPAANVEGQSTPVATVKDQTWFTEVSCPAVEDITPELTQTATAQPEGTLSSTDETGAEEIQNMVPAEKTPGRAHTAPATSSAEKDDEKSARAGPQMAGNSSAGGTVPAEISPAAAAGVVSFRATCFRAGGGKQGHAFSSNEGAENFGGAVQELFNWKVQMKGYDLEVILDVAFDLVSVGLSLTPVALFYRNLVKMGPTSLRSTVCYNLLMMTKPQPYEVVVDPMCGGGSISLEGAQAFPGTFHLCGDSYPNAAARVALNREFSARQFGSSAQLALDVFTWDCTRLPLRDACADVIVSDLPFGKRMGSKFDNRTLYPACMEEMARICTPRYGRAVLLTQDKRTMEKTLHLGRIKSLWRCRASPYINVGGLDGCAYFLQRTDFVHRPRPLPPIAATQRGHLPAAHVSAADAVKTPGAAAASDVHSKLADEAPACEAAGAEPLETMGAPGVKPAVEPSGELAAEQVTGDAQGSDVTKPEMPEAATSETSAEAVDPVEAVPSSGTTIYVVAEVVSEVIAPVTAPQVASAVVCATEATTPDSESLETAPPDAKVREASFYGKGPEEVSPDANVLEEASPNANVSEQASPNAKMAEETPPNAEVPKQTSSDAKDPEEVSPEDPEEASPDAKDPEKASRDAEDPEEA